MSLVNGNTPQPMLTIPVVAARLRVSVRTVHRLIADDKLTAYKLGPRAICVKAEDLNRYIVSNGVPDCVWDLIKDEAS